MKREDKYLNFMDGEKGKKLKPPTPTPHFQREHF